MGLVSHLVDLLFKVLLLCSSVWSGDVSVIPLPAKGSVVQMYLHLVPLVICELVNFYGV